jgi:hypothetical protein
VVDNTPKLVDTIITMIIDYVALHETATVADGHSLTNKLAGLAVIVSAVPNLASEST